LLESGCSIRLDDFAQRERGSQSSHLVFELRHPLAQDAVLGLDVEMPLLESPKTLGELTAPRLAIRPSGDVLPRVLARVLGQLERLAHDLAIAFGARSIGLDGLRSERDERSDRAEKAEHQLNR